MLSRNLGQNLNEPNYQPEKIAFFQNECDGKIVLLPEGSGVKTGIRLKTAE